MKKKLAWLLATCLCTGLISYALLGLDNSTVSAELSQQTKGSFVRLEDGSKKVVVSVDGNELVYPVSSTVWVYKNSQKSDLGQLQAGDTLELILNSKDQAAYIKASAPEATAPQADSASTSTEESSSGNAGASSAAESSPAADTSPVPGPTMPSPAATGAAAGAAGAATPTADGSSIKQTAEQSSAAWEKLSFEWKSSGLVLEVKLGADSSQAENELYLKRSDKSVIHLDGAPAAALAQLFLKGLPADREAFEKALRQKIASEFQVKDTSPEWKMDVKWKEASKSLPVPAAAAQAVHPDPQGKAKGVAKEHTAPNKDKDPKEKGKEKEKDDSGKGPVRKGGHEGKED